MQEEALFFFADKDKQEEDEHTIPPNQAEPNVAKNTPTNIAANANTEGASTSEMATSSSLNAKTLNALMERLPFKFHPVQQMLPNNVAGSLPTIEDDEVGEWYSGNKGL
ncbi:hypothetical protein [Flagellimonas marinaquae]